MDGSGSGIEMIYFLLSKVLAPFLVGSCIGSFLNVCIYRMPIGKSVVYPGSHCATCGSPITWQNNIPVLSWFILKGRAACCGTRIDMRYPFVEALTGVLFVFVWVIYPWDLAICYSIFVATLILGSFVDLDHMIIPDASSFGGLGLGVLCSLLVPELHGTVSLWEALGQSLFGAVLGAGVLLIVALIGLFIFQKEAMGMGDVFWMLSFGAFLGWKAVPFIIAVSACVGSVVSITAILMRGHWRWGNPVPFGPFLAIACVIWLFGGNYWMNWYFEEILKIPA